MSEYDEQSHETPSLVSLAGFAVLFFGILALTSWTGLSFEPVREWLATLSAEARMAGMAAFILGIMAIARIMMLIGKGFAGRAS